MLQRRVNGMLVCYMMMAVGNLGIHREEVNYWTWWAEAPVCGGDVVLTGSDDHTYTFYRDRRFRILPAPVSPRFLFTERTTGVFSLWRVPHVLGPLTSRRRQTMAPLCAVHPWRQVDSDKT